MILCDSLGSHLRIHVLCWHTRVVRHHLSTIGTYRNHIVWHYLLGSHHLWCARFRWHSLLWHSPREPWPWVLTRARGSQEALLGPWKPSMRSRAHRWRCTPKVEARPRAGGLKTIGLRGLGGLTRVALGWVKPWAIIHWVVGWVVLLARVGCGVPWITGLGLGPRLTEGGVRRARVARQGMGRVARGHRRKALVRSLPLGWVLLPIGGLRGTIALLQPTHL